MATQDVDQRTFNWNASLAQVKAARANVERLVAEEGFKHLIAPFDGVVTARDTDVGALINVGAAGGSALFVVSWPLGLLVSSAFFLVTIVTTPLIVRLVVSSLYAGRALDAASTLEVDGERLRVTSAVAGASRREWVIERSDVERVDERGRLIVIHLREGDLPRVALPRPPIAAHPDVLAAIRGLAQP